MGQIEQLPWFLGKLIDRLLLVFAVCYEKAVLEWQ